MHVHYYATLACACMLFTIQAKRHQGVSTRSGQYRIKTLPHWSTGHTNDFNMPWVAGVPACVWVYSMSSPPCAFVCVQPFAQYMPKCAVRFPRRAEGQRSANTANGNEIFPQPQICIFVRQIDVRFGRARNVCYAKRVFCAIFLSHSPFELYQL